MTKRIEDMQQTTVNWLSPCDQSVLETTLGYEQVAVDLTAWLAQNEPDEYVKETFNFGLLEDFDHLYIVIASGRIWNTEFLQTKFCKLKLMLFLADQLKITITAI